MREAILNVLHVRFTALATATQVQQAIAPSQDMQLLRTFHRQLFGVSDEHEVLALLTENFPLLGELKGLQEAILDVVNDRFSPQLVAQVQQAIAPSQDLQLLRKFHRQLFGVSDEQEVSALLTECFPTS